MDRKPNKPFDSGWNIPKKTQPKSSQAPMNMTIPKKKKMQPPSSSSLAGSVPRKSSFPSSSSSSHPPMHASIPRKSSVGESSTQTAIPPRKSSSSSIPRKASFGGTSIPRKSAFEGTSIPRKSSMDKTSIPRKSSFSEKIPRRSSSSSFPSSSATTATTATSIPRKRLPHSKRHSRSTTDITTVSEYPFVLKIPLKGIPMTVGIPPRHASSTGGGGRKRKTVSYQELDDTDSDDFMTDDDEHQRNLTKKGRHRKTTIAPPDSTATATTGTAADTATTAAPTTTTTAPTTAAPTTAAPTTAAPTTTPTTSAATAASSVSSIPSTDADATTPMPLDDQIVSITALLGARKSLPIDAPPPGTLNTLWYSRECFMHSLVVERILAWRTRVVSSLEWVPETLTPPKEEEGYIHPRPAINSAEAAKWSTMAVTNPVIWSDPNKRMEVSRLVPAECPVVMTMAVKYQNQKPATNTNTEGESKPPLPRYRIKPFSEQDREEVYLVKWRGKSHLHASWERGSDIIKYDQSKNTARHKIRRFVQSQELAYGQEWKQVLEEERKTTATIHAHGDQNQTSTTDSDGIEDENYPPACTEVERILACDESEMDMTLYAKQRALNIIKEQKLVNQRESGMGEKWNSEEGLSDLLKEMPWDPEDNVRYVVKWKGLPFAEMTWEYWRDIKTDAVDHAENFWWRQQPPDEETIQRNNRPHPRIRDFKKIQESPIYGRSKRERPVADLGQKKEEDSEETNPAFRLRSYQLEGVNWLLFNWWNKRSCILADEMGLGKTIQSMCFLQSLQDNPETGVRGPFLIVAPLSLIGQWQSEALTWAPDLNVVLYHGSADARDFLVKQDFYYTDQFVPKATAIKLKKQHVTKFHILITTYEVAMKDVNVLSKIRWRALIVDEAHRLKNHKSRLFSELAAVPRDYCLLLTGTPLANATEELWALLHFADKNAFASKDDFLDKFGQLTDAKQVNELHSVLKPFLLRRVKEDVEKSLPPKEETILEVSLTPVQKQFYKAIYERNTTFLYKGSKPSNAPSLMNVMMELRKCCNHPYLVRGAEERILADAASQMKNPDGTDMPVDWTKLFEEQLVKSSGKMVLISKLLPKLFANGHKVLIFSQMVRVLDLLEEFLKIKRYKYERLDGSTSSSSRASAVDRFVRKSCQRFVMLLSTRAGGLGLNLTAADTVIIFDSDWNPQNDLQAMARAHRIGQTRAVRVYRLLTAKTYEMHMFHSASMKLGLERAVLSQQRDQDEEEEGGKSKSKSKSEKEAQAKKIDSLLKKGAYDVFRDDNDDEAKKFMETDIDQLLEQSTTTVTYGANKTKLSSGLGSFSKASFVADTGDGEKDVDLDDPDFWQKAVGLEKPVETPEEVAQMIDDGVKRSRKQVQVYDPYAEFAEMEQRKEEEEKRRKQEEKEERERQRKEKKKRKENEKERKRREREEARGLKARIEQEEEEEESVQKKQPKELKPKKVKKVPGKKRLSRHILNDNPDGWLRQGWDVPQRNRAIAACLRFGFTRFCRIRNESNLTSLPIQDFEVFFRSYFYQLSLQVAVTFMRKLKHENSIFTEANLKAFLQECLGMTSSKEIEWLCGCLSNGMRCYLEVESQRKFLRLPLALTEPTFVDDLRRGAALRSLRRMFLLCRVQRIVEDCLDEIVAQLGYEQLAKRGCQTSNITTMDADLKARLVTTEELSLAINLHLKKVDHRLPVIWWDRSCDIALLIGTFVHGLGNHDAMLNDAALPFSFRINKFAKADEACIAAQKLFDDATVAARKVFDESLEAFDLKEQKRNLAIISAAAANQAAREKEALALREGGAAADAVHSKMPGQVPNNRYEIVDGDDSHYVTLPRLQENLLQSVRNDKSSSEVKEESEVSMDVDGQENDATSQETSRGRRAQTRYVLSMPDARVLRCRLDVLIKEVERNLYEDDTTSMKLEEKLRFCKIWPCSKVVATNCEIRARALSVVSGKELEDLNDHPMGEYLGIGISGNQCAASHRTLDDGTDFSIGAASPDVAQVGCATSRYVRAIGVPMILTRFAISALIHADTGCVDHLLESERICNYSEDFVADDAQSDAEDDVKAETGNDSVKTEANGEDKNGKSSDEAGAAKPEAEAVTGNTKEETKSEQSVSMEVDENIEETAQVPKVFEENSKLRASICVVILHYGFFSTGGANARVSKPLWGSIREHCGEFEESEPPPLYNAERFQNLVREFGGGVDVPDKETIENYVESCLLPHCLRLCLMGNGPTITGVRGSNGEYETAYGTSLYPEHTENLQSPLPDPCLDLSEHSIEALGTAYAILRRVRLMRAAVSLANGKAPLSKIDKILRSSFMRKSMDGLPVWWCPWIHDAALLVHASTRGLYSILKDRKSEENTSPFSRKTIVQHMYATFLAENALPSSITEGSPPEDSTSWIELQASDFPTVNVLERRLAFLCARATEHLSGNERYDNLPMFDHGSWPRN